MKLLALILSLLQKLVSALERQQRKQEQRQHEERVNDVQENPVNWFDDHFNGVRNNELPDNASETNEAYFREHKADERRRDDTKQG